MSNSLLMNETGGKKTWEYQLWMRLGIQAEIYKAEAEITSGPIFSRKNNVPIWLANPS